MERTELSLATIIVDDNEIDRLTTQLYTRSYPFLNVNGVFENAEDALLFLKNNKPDVLLLDIDLPGISGHEFRRQIGLAPACIFITAYPEYAVDSFELAALDFLVKPLDKNRFATAMARLKDYMDTRQKASILQHSLLGGSLFIKEGRDQLKVQVSDILYLEALKDYTRIVTPQNKYYVLTGLGNLLQEDVFKTFVRIHRSFAVQAHFIEKMTSKEVHLKSITLPIGRSYKDNLVNQNVYKSGL